MRGSDERTGSLFSYVGIEERLRAIRTLTDKTLASMERDLAALYLGIGRPSIAPQMLLRAMLLQAFYSVRSERQLTERMEFDLVFRFAAEEARSSRMAARTVPHSPLGQVAKMLAATSPVAIARPLLVLGVWVSPAKLTWWTVSS